MTRALSTMLMDSDGQQLLKTASASFFWSEHSPRATLPTWVATLGGSEEIRGKLGRWKSSRSCTEGYSRQDKIIIFRVQANTAAVIRKGAGQATDNDPFGERSLLRTLRTRLEHEGYTEYDIDGTISNLTHFGEPRSEKMASDFIEDIYAEVEFPMLDDNDMAAFPPATIPGGFDDEEDGELPKDDEENEDLRRLPEKKAEIELPAALIVDPESDDDLSDVPRSLDYVTSCTKKTGTRCLHRVGWCWRVPGIDYKIHMRFPQVPPQAEYDSMCKHCWRHQELGHDQLPRGAGCGSSSTSSSSRAELSDIVSFEEAKDGLSNDEERFLSRAE